MTSYDRHASHDSPYRTGRHVPLSQSRHEPLTSIATSAIESRPDLSTPTMTSLQKDLQVHMHPSGMPPPMTWALPPNPTHQG
jgi:hypothetical protein